MIRKMWKRTLLAGTAACCLLLNGNGAIADVYIERDDYGVPFIYGNTDAEMFFGYGYAMAEDRLLQILKLKLISSGVYPNDTAQKNQSAGYRAIRTYRIRYPNLERDIENELSELAAKGDRHSQRAIKALDCIADGINRFLAETFPDVNTGRLAGKCAGRSTRIEKLGQAYNISGEEIAYVKGRLDAQQGVFRADWRANDVLKIFQNRVMDEFSNRNEEVNNQVLLRALEAVHGSEKGRRMFNGFKWVADPNAITEIKNFKEAGDIPLAAARDEIKGYRAAHHRRLIGNGAACQEVADRIPELSYAAYDQGADRPGFSQNASNFWAIANKNAGPLEMKAGMFNGPQVGIYDPNSFYPFKMMSGEGFRYAGTSFAGTLTTFNGHNGKVASGFTAGNADVSDVFCIKVTSEEQGRYTDGQLTLVPNPGTGTLYVEHYNWPVVRFDKSKAGDSVAYIQRHVWQGATALTFKSFLQSATANTLDEWQTAMDTVGANFNMVGASEGGLVSMRLTGVIPPRNNLQDGGKIPLRSLGLNPKRYLWNQDVRLPVAASPLDGWHEGERDFYKLNETTDQGYVTSWNHKPYLLMPDSDLYYDAWYQWDRAGIIEEMLKRKSPQSIGDLTTLNSVLSRMDINFHYFAPFLRTLSQAGVFSQQEAEKVAKILSWNGFRGKPGAAGPENCRVPLPAVPVGQPLFMNFFEELGQVFSAIFIHRDRGRLQDLWKPYGKLKQPFYSKLQNTTSPQIKPKLDFSTSQNVYILGKVMLLNLKFAFDPTFRDFDALGWNFLLNKPLQEEDRRATQATAIHLMKIALNKAREEKGFSSCYGISTSLNNAFALSQRNLHELAIPYFRNRGAQNHVVAFMNVPLSAGGVEGKQKAEKGQSAASGPASSKSIAVARNVVAPGVREFRGRSLSTPMGDISSNQRKLVNEDGYRDMGFFSMPRIRDKPSHSRL